MKIKLNGDHVFTCNFCENQRGNVYEFIRNEGNSLQARMCEKCLDELISFHVFVKLKQQPKK